MADEATQPAKPESPPDKTGDSTPAAPPAPNDGNAIELTRRGEVNFLLTLGVIVLFLFYYYRHYSELVGIAAANSVGIGFAVVITALRASIWAAVKKQVLPRLGKIAARILNSKWLTYFDIIAIVVLVILLAITSSIVLTYDEKVKSPPFKVGVSGGGKPFKTLELAISSTHPVAGAIYVTWFPKQELKFGLKTPLGLDVPPPETFAPYSRIRLEAPSSFHTPELYLMTIVPGPKLLRSLPAVTTKTPATRYYLRIRSHVGEKTLTGNLTKGVVITGAELRYLPTSLSDAEATALPKKFSGVFGEKLEGPSLELVLSNVVPIECERFDPEETVTIEAGRVAKDGRLEDPIAKVTPRAAAGNQLVFLERP